MNNKECQRCVHEDKKYQCGGEGNSKCFAREENTCNIKESIFNRFNMVSPAYLGSCVYGCNFCIKNKKSKEPMSRYDWAYS